LGFACLVLISSGLVHWGPDFLSKNFNFICPENYKNLGTSEKLEINFSALQSMFWVCVFGLSIC